MARIDAGNKDGIGRSKTVSGDIVRRTSALRGTDDGLLGRRATNTTSFQTGRQQQH